MNEFSYSDFDLRFSGAKGSYLIEFEDSSGKTLQHQFGLPFHDREVENYLLKIGQHRRRGRKGVSSQERAAREFGTKLFGAVFAGDVHDEFFRRRDAATSAGGGLRIRLQLQLTPALAELPWEFLHDPQSREFLTLSRETPIVRYFDLRKTAKVLAVSPPLRILVMISDPSNVVGLDVDLEWRNLKSALSGLEERGLVIVERLRKATVLELQACLRKKAYHVFHFIGHGSFDPEAGEGSLVMEDDAGRRCDVLGSKLGVFLRDEPTLQLAILNSCEGARASASDAFSGAAQTLVLMGISAVIAMQFEVSDEAAIAFATGFYSAVADNYPVDAALSEARKQMFGASEDAEWGTPVLYLRAANGRIFDVGEISQLPPIAIQPEPEVARSHQPEIVQPNPQAIAREPKSPLVVPALADDLQKAYSLPRALITIAALLLAPSFSLAVMLAAIHTSRHVVPLPVFPPPEGVVQWAEGQRPSGVARVAAFGFDVPPTASRQP